MSQILDAALIGIVPVRIVKTISHTLGNVAVGHAIGQGVRLNQRVNSENPETVSIQAEMIDDDRFTKKFLIEALNATQIPFPFVSRLVAIPLVRITGLAFSQDSGSKNVDDKLPVITFSITMQEVKIGGLLGASIKVATKIAWITAANSLPDPAYDSVSTFDNSDKIKPAESRVDEKIYICSEVGDPIADLDQNKQQYYYDLQEFYLGQELEDVFNASLRLDAKFYKLPIAPADRFPQTITINYPIVPVDFEQFNIETNLDEIQHVQSGLYYHPEYSVTESEEYIITITPVQVNGVIDTSMLVEKDGVTLFDQKILPCEIYQIDDIEIKFKTIEIFTDSIYGNSQNTDIVGGVRLRQ